MTHIHLLTVPYSLAPTDSPAEPPGHTRFPFQFILTMSTAQFTSSTGPSAYGASVSSPATIQQPQHGEAGSDRRKYIKFPEEKKEYLKRRLGDRIDVPCEAELRVWAAEVNECVFELLTALLNLQPDMPLTPDRTIESETGFSTARQHL